MYALLKIRILRTMGPMLAKNNLVKIVFMFKT